MKPFTLVLAGNPNAGKTTLFNALTGARQKVGNWSGVTVEVMEGTAVRGETSYRIIDLPGTYSLSPRSPEESLALNCLLSGSADVFINVVDASNLERNLYLTVQLLEMNLPLCLALNMSDELARRGETLDLDKLGRLLGLPIVPTVGRIGKGMDDLLDSAARVARKQAPVSRSVRVPYGSEIEEEITRLETLISIETALCLAAPARWYAIRLLEGDARVEAFFGPVPRIPAMAAECRRHLEDIFHEDAAAVIAGQRYGFISGALHETLTTRGPDQLNFTKRIDGVLLQPVVAYLFFGALMWALFMLTFKLGAFPAAGIQAGVRMLSDAATQILPNGLLKDLFIQGILAGAGSVLVFLPNILILFFGISMMEDTGYMARAAFLMDKIMHKMGLHGKSFIPMVMGLGCNVPAILAARTLEARSDRKSVV